jgi:squalene-associated FAD-dependent desaturase
VETRTVPPTHVAVIGGGLSGLAAATALADSECRVSLFERSPRLGGRATSYVLPGDEQIDNCQHVTLRCCTNLQHFYSRAGVSDKIAFHDSLIFADSRGRRAGMRPANLPAPFHLMPSFATFRLLGWKDKYSIAQAMLSILMSGGRTASSKSLSMLDWLRKHRQTTDAIRYFWQTVLVSALNEELDRIEAAYGIDVFWKAFLSNREGFLMGLPSVPLAELYATSGDCIAQSGGKVRTRCGVGELRISGGRVEGITLEDGTIVLADYCISAIPFERLPKILPDSWKDREPFRQLEHLHVSPITGVHLWFDRAIMTEPFLTSVDQTIQWIFNKDAGRHLQIVISASRNLSPLPQQQIADLCIREMSALLPLAREATLLRSVVVRENSATFSPEPGCDRWRPKQRTPISNLMLAGDWTDTGWPATMEGAVRSGYLAAEAILEMEGRPKKLIQPDLPATGISKWFARREQFTTETQR